MNGEFRERAVLPLAMPLAILAVIGALVFGFSRILLAVPKEVAVAVALMVAINVLGTCAALSAFPRLRGARAMPLLAVALVPAVVGAAIAAVTGEEGGEDGAPAAVEIAASNLAFTTSELKAPADREFVIRFDNREGQPHNIEIFQGSDAAGEKVFSGEIFTGPATREYRVKPLAAGSYFFHCQVHPTTMAGTLVVEGDAGAPAGAAAEISAKNIAFDKAQLELPADTGSTIRFKNDEAQPHNIAIFQGADATGEKVFTGETFTGPATKTYAIKALPPGSYYFHCDVHPNMRGTITVR